MKIFNNFEALGDNIPLNKTNPKHFGTQIQNKEESDDVAASFGDMLNGAMKKVNNTLVDKDKLEQKMITAPNEVNAHEVMAAFQKAQFVLSFTKAVRDRIVHAYQEIMNMR